MINSRKRQLIIEAEAEEKKQKVSQPHRVYYGLYNQGATCYLNSVLQVLFMTTEIHDRLDPESQITDEELRNMFEKLKETTCGTENITKSLEITNVQQQRDAAECLEMILHKVSPQASQVFQGQLTCSTKCSKGHSINEETNSFWTLPLSLKDAHDSTYSVERGFKKFFQTKSFSGDNMVFCTECKKKTEATTGCEMVEFPQVLTLLLKRFDFDYNTMSHVKSDRRVDVPPALQRKNRKYKLYGMVNHMGGLSGGHYTSTVLSSEDKIWYECNDAFVKMVEEQPFARQTYKSGTVYLLMYRATEPRLSCENNSERLTEKVKEDENGDEGEEGGKEDAGRVTNRETGGDAGDGEDCTESIDGGHEEENGDNTRLSITTDTFEYLDETKVNDAPAMFGERTTESSPQRLEAEKKRQRDAACAVQRPEYSEQAVSECRRLTSEDLSIEVEEEIRMERLSRAEVTNLPLSRERPTSKPKRVQCYLIVFCCLLLFLILLLLVRASLMN